MRHSLTTLEISNIIHKVTGLTVDNFLLLEAIKSETTIPVDNADAILEERIQALLHSTTPYKIVGVTFDDRQTTIKSIEEDDILILQREPENKFDPNAVAVLTLLNEPVGYLPKNFALLVNDIVEHLQVKVVAKLGGGNYSYGLRVKFIRKNSPDFLNIQLINDELSILTPEQIRQGEKKLNNLIKTA